MNGAYWLNTAWMLACMPSARAFAQATRSVARTQGDLLGSILRANQGTAIGRRHDFASIRDVVTFQARVPLGPYDSYADAIGRIAAGETHVLTSEPVSLLEPTSGSTAAEKLIPYTSGLRRQFQAAIGPWIADLLMQRPKLRGGRAYWSISPAFGRERRSAGGIPIGFEDDTAYLGFFERMAVGRLLAVPSTVARLTDLDEFRYTTLLHLLCAADLTLISVWSPTFLTALLRPLDEWLDRLCGDIARGVGQIPPDPGRANEVRRMCRSGGSGANRFRAIWPRLQLISCWADAAASGYIPQLRDTFPGVEIQPKGLIATEAFVSFPLLGQTGAVLAVRSHFFEFQECDGTERCRLAHELDIGGRYRVVVTTAGGLYRYQLGDEVEIVGRFQEAPLLRFLGKADLVSDWCGEKLSEPFVRSTLARLWRSRGLTPSFFLLGPVIGDPPRYRLVVQGVPASAGVEKDLQVFLEENPHYRYAARMGQLGPVEVRVLDAEVDAWGLFTAARAARGQKLGNIKPAVLDVNRGWEAAFE